MKKILKHLLPTVAVVALGSIGFSAMLNTASSEKRTEVEVAKLKVSVVEAKLEPIAAKIQGTGVVQPAQVVSIVPEVAGRVISVAKNLQPGGRFLKGQRLAKIEPADYQINVVMEESRLAQAGLNAQLEEERQAAAEREWKLLNHQGEPTDLALRKPQVAAANANLEAAQAGLDRAELNLKRTELKAPFNGMIRTESLEVGQVVGGAPVVDFIGTDLFWVRVSVPTKRLAEINVPQINSDIGSKANIVFSPGGEMSVQKQGEVLHLEGQLDVQTRTAYLLVSVENPLDGSGIPLLPGAYVDVEIEGRAQNGAIEVPAVSLKDGNHVLVVDEQGLLARRDVQVGWLEQDKAILLDGVEAGEKIITTPISYPIYGQEVSIVDAGGEQ